ncbi:hypothetical protein [Luteimicrobium subarcticum]|uniref:Ig-like domain-containing protein n=1 Tax=Luteimicrobium subarcticum TaxID=620910 RepID=A0A2M8WVU9_9MICO|nr:hypothetical protein [Luteimicrobium subarcticum]PJI95033.1 hypothetical protein CLV34_0885 [Luteimicrobium subarcticum]
MSYTYLELNKGSGQVWVTESTAATAKALGSTNAGLHPRLVVDTTKLVNGTYGLKIDAVGKNGKTTEKKVSFTVDNPPALSFGAPSSGATVSGTVAGSVDRAGAGLQAYDLRVDSAGLQHVYQPTAGTFTFRLDTSTSSDGVHTLLATATNTSGEKTTVTEKITVKNAS